MIRRRAGLLSVAVTLMAWPVYAQDSSSPEYVEARQRLQEGKALYGQGNLDGARLKFEQACAVLKTPACQRALGLADFYTKRYLEALGNLQRALDDKELDTAQRKQITDLMQQAYDKTGHLEVHAPAGAHVRIDESIDAGNAPLADAVNVTVGSHIVSATVQEKTERKTVDCPEGKVVRVDFADSASSTPHDTQNAHGAVPPAASSSTTLFPPPNGAIVAGAIGLVGIGMGIGFGVASGSANSDNLARGAGAGGVCSINPNSQVCLDAKSTLNTQQADAVVSTISYVIGGVGLAAAVVWWLLAPRKVVEHHAMLVPGVGPHTVGAAFHFRF